MDVAINVQKILLGENRVIFKPSGLLKGNYYEDKDSFIDEYGYEYSDMEGTNFFDDRYFCCPISINQLKEVYSGIIDDNQILEEFLYSFINVCFIGFFDVVSFKIKLAQVNFDKLEQILSNDKESQAQIEDLVLIEQNESSKYTFNEESLKALKNYKTVEEIRNYIDQLISISDQIKQTNQAQTNEEENTIQPSGTLALKKEESKKFTLKDMRKFVLAQIVAQDDAVKRITTRIMANFDSSDYRRKGHLLITGGTGTGKSKTIELICNYLNIPFAKVDSTDYTQTGYVGRSVDEMLQKLIAAADGDVELAQKGILVIDEIDKKAPTGDKSSVATKAVLDSLLKITGRGTVEVDIVEDGEKVTIDFDTSNLTVVFTGAFEGIEKLENENKKTTVGFVQEEDKVADKTADLNKLLIKYGMTPELIGRIKCIVPLKKYEVEDYIQILKKSQGSPLLIEKNYFENDKGIKFTYTSNYLKEIAKKAKERNVGVRGLESAVAESLEDVQERVLNQEKIKVLKLTKKTVLNNKEYYVE